MAVVWHIYYFVVSLLDSFEITKIDLYLYNIYQGFMFHIGKVHEYLGMDLDYIYKVAVKVSMIKFLNSVIK